LGCFAQKKTSKVALRKPYLEHVWGVAYFLGEKIVVVALAVMEIRLARAEV
jgi:hypothetical protein